MKIKTIVTICFIALGALQSGCNTDKDPENSNLENSSQMSSNSDAHPNLSLHKPKTFASAIERLRQIHESLMGNDDFPQPITIPYVEVIHGQGPSGHSHFYSAADYEANGGDDHDDEHHEEDETVKHHSIEVSLQTELADVIKWLPDTAAKSNLRESDWNSVNSISSRLAKIIDAIAVDASDSSFRESWKLKSEEIENMLNELQSLAGTTGATK